VGYEDYLSEQRYREDKAAQLLAWIANSATRPIRSMLEIGSAYGFSRVAAERRGWRTFGVDLNPHAAATARKLYGFETFIGTLEQALAAGAVASGAWDLVLYQFVLEHVVDPIHEMRQAAKSATPLGVVALLVPSMQAVERLVFGASYRSLRPDHLHLFSWKSLDFCLTKAGLTRMVSRSQCSVHLLAGFLTEQELTMLYERGDGPDLVAIVAKEIS
jgi:SAM-dependent methyltransferase